MLWKDLNQSGIPWQLCQSSSFTSQNYLSEDGFEFTLLGRSLLQQLNVRNNTDKEPRIYFTHPWNHMQQLTSCRCYLMKTCKTFKRCKKMKNNNTCIKRQKKITLTPITTWKHVFRPTFECSYTTLSLVTFTSLYILQYTERLDEAVPIEYRFTLHR